MSVQNVPSPTIDHFIEQVVLSLLGSRLAHQIWCHVFHHWPSQATPNKGHSWFAFVETITKIWFAVIEFLKHFKFLFVSLDPRFVTSDGGEQSLDLIFGLCCTGLRHSCLRIIFDWWHCFRRGEFGTQFSLKPTATCLWIPHQDLNAQLMSVSAFKTSTFKHSFNQTKTFL